MSATTKDKAGTSEEVPVATPEVATLAVVEDPIEAEVDRILPESTEVALSDGTAIEVLPLKTRQFLKMMRIVTRGGANILPTMALNFDGNIEEFATSLIALVLFAIPEAEDETIEFVNSMIAPKVPEESAHLTDLMSNPEIDDLITVVEAIVRREASDLKALGKRLGAMMKLAQKTGQIPTS